MDLGLENSLLGPLRLSVREESGQQQRGCGAAAGEWRSRAGALQGRCGAVPAAGRARRPQRGGARRAEVPLPLGARGRGARRVRAGEPGSSFGVSGGGGGTPTPVPGAPERASARRPLPGARPAAAVVALLAVLGGPAWRGPGRLVPRRLSRAARGGLRPGGEELSRLRLDDLAPTPRPARGPELLYGLSPCLLALRAGRRRVARLLLQAGEAGPRGPRAELLRAAEARAVPVLRPRRQKLDALCRHQVHQGVCMEVSRLRPRPCSEVAVARPGDDAQQLWLVLEGLQDPRNLGAVLRSAHYLGVDKVITSRRNSCPLTPVVSKASAGAMEVMDVFSTDDLPGFLQAKAEQGWLVAGTMGSLEPEVYHSSEIPITSCLEFLWDQPTLLVLGNEGSGLSPEVQASCQLLLTILPGRQLPPGFESLNVSVAAGILLHSICSQRKGFPAEGKRGQLLQEFQEPSTTCERPRVAQDPGLSSGSEKERQDGG